MFSWWNSPDIWSQTGRRLPFRPWIDWGCQIGDRKYKHGVWNVCRWRACCVFILLDFSRDTLSPAFTKLSKKMPTIQKRLALITSAAGLAAAILYNSNNNKHPKDILDDFKRSKSTLDSPKPTVNTLPTRKQHLENLETRKFDLLIIGGGATGGM